MGVEVGDEGLSYSRHPKSQDCVAHSEMYDYDQAVISTSSSPSPIPGLTLSLSLSSHLSLPNDRVRAGQIRASSLAVVSLS
jgi:hypothetical protein